jgi:Tfp pilus assembly protein PilF
MKVLFCLAISFLTFSFQSIAQKATVTENRQSLNTYGFSDPDPVAQPGHIYPYFRFDGYTNKGEMKSWKFVELENDFIKVSITPEIGGKIWGAYEKSTNFPYVYFNHAVKFRDIAMRGAWTSGGIEINFGDIGHDPTVATPVDYFYRTNADQSVSCFVGAYDWASRTRWAVEVNLPKDKAFFTTKSTWYNASTIDQTYYHWMNAGFRAKGNLELAFPGTNYIGHGGELNKYPINNDGKEISFYEKNNFGSYKSYHVLGKPADFYGGYWHDDKVGFVHYSPYFQKLGKKIWIWGLSRQGMIWENLLTDTDGQYVELQSGRLFNQAAKESDKSPFKHFAFQPYTSDTFTESWYPVKNTGGISDASSWGAWKINQNKGWLSVSISAVESIAENLTFLKNNEKITKKIQLKPLEVYKDSVQVSENDKLTIQLGQNKLYSNLPEKETSERPLESPKDFDWNSEYGMYMKAKGLANQRLYNEAEEGFKKLLAKNQYHIPALGEMAQMSYRKGMYNEAMNFAKKGLSINTYDPLCNYMLGLASVQNQNLMTAKDAFSVTVLSPQYRSSSFMELAKIATIEQDFTKATHLIEEALTANPKNQDAQHLQLVILRKTNQTDLAIIASDAILNTDPLDHLARFERIYHNNSEENVKLFKSIISNELPHENYIEMALWYRSINEMDAAERLLSMSPNTVMVSLWAADIAKNEALIEKTLAMQPDFVFPFRHEEEGLLKRLIEKNNGENKWKLHYYYGLLLWQFNRIDEAKKQFTLAGDKPNFTPFYLTKAEIFENDKVIAQKSLEKANEISPNDWRAASKLANFYAKNNNVEKALETNEKVTRKTEHETYILDQQRADFYEKLGRYKDCIELLKNLNILPSEIAPFAHQLYRKANLKMAILLIKKGNKTEATIYLNQAKTWLENLGSGEPYDPDNKLADMLINYLSDNDKRKLTTQNDKLSKADKAILEGLSK